MITLLHEMSSRATACTAGGPRQPRRRGWQPRHRCQAHTAARACTVPCPHAVQPHGDAGDWRRVHPAHRTRLDHGISCQHVRSGRTCPRGPSPTTGASGSSCPNRDAVSITSSTLCSISWLIVATAELGHMALADHSAREQSAPPGPSRCCSHRHRPRRWDYGAGDACHVEGRGGRAKATLRTPY